MSIANAVSLVTFNWRVTLECLDCCSQCTKPVNRKFIKVKQYYMIIFDLKILLPFVNGVKRPKFSLSVSIFSTITFTSSRKQWAYFPNHCTMWLSPLKSCNKEIGQNLILPFSWIHIISDKIFGDYPRSSFTFIYIWERVEQDGGYPMESVAIEAGCRKDVN